MFLLVLAALLALPAWARPSAPTAEWFAPHGNGRFSSAAQDVCAEPPSATAVDRLSPDRRRRITMRIGRDGGGMAVSAVDDAGRETAIDTAAWSCPEIGWSPTSDRFFVSYSDGGGVGTWHVSAYRIAAGKWQRIELETAVRRDFLRGYPKCFEPETPNITGIAWARDGRRLLLAAQVLPHANCDDLGTFRLYEVAVPDGTIPRRVDQRNAKRSFGKLLGPELRAANDGCFTKPGSCNIPALHGHAVD